MEQSLNYKIGKIAGSKPQLQITDAGDHLQHFSLAADIAEDVQQDIWKIDIELPFTSDFFWAPHLVPDEGYIIDQHSFRCPALIARNKEQLFIVLPDLDVMKTSANRWFMDLDAPNGIFSLGVSKCQVPQHVLFYHKKGNVFHKGTFRFAFYIYYVQNTNEVKNPFRYVLDFYWKKEGVKMFAAGEPEHAPLLQYCRRTYQWAFKNWEKVVWQSFCTNGKQVGAPAFIVNYTQSPNYTGNPTWRECLSIWNQAWFSSLRSASGLYRYAQETGNAELKEKALMTKELALHMPQREDGLFYSVVATEMIPENTDQGTIWKSAGWDTRFYGNSNRNPITGDIKESPFHLVDMSITASHMLRWYRQLEQDDRLLEYSKRYAEGLLQYQRSGGFFPAWITSEGVILDELQVSPETSASVTFLTELYELTGCRRYLDAAIKAMNAVCSEIIPTGRWEDFETYWSCSRWGGEFLGKKIPRNGMYKQCNFSMFWTAEALMRLYEVTKDTQWLFAGQYVLDELLMTQAVWQPPFMRVPVFGGFGVMNCDGEWLDARQSLFAEVIIQYGIMLNKEEYIQRGIAAMRASFVMMYCPENPKVKVEWEKRWPFFGEQDYGFTMENYGHDGIIDESYTGIGEFTIYDWGNGAASEAYMRISQKYPQLLKQYGEM